MGRHKQGQGRKYLRIAYCRKKKIKAVWTYRQNERQAQAPGASVVRNWKPTRKRPVGRPKKRAMDNIEKDLKCGFVIVWHYHRAKPS
jgi:hypothetical protein